MMTAADLDLVQTLAGICRRHGIKHVHIGDVHLEMGIKESEMKQDTKRDVSDMCSCGHHVSAHDAGICTEGDCDPNICQAVKA